MFINVQVQIFFYELTSKLSFVPLQKKKKNIPHFQVHKYDILLMYFHHLRDINVQANHGAVPVWINGSWSPSCLQVRLQSNKN